MFISWKNLEEFWSFICSKIFFCLPPSFWNFDYTYNRLLDITPLVILSLLLFLSFVRSVFPQYKNYRQCKKMKLQTNVLHKHWCKDILQNIMEVKSSNTSWPSEGCSRNVNLAQYWKTIQCNSPYQQTNK